MKLYIHPTARSELKELTKKKRSFVRNIVEEFEEKGTEYQHFGKLTVKQSDQDLFRLKLKENNSHVEINQRIIVDIFEDQYVAYGINHRDNVYTKEYIEEIKDRMY